MLIFQLQIIGYGHNLSILTRIIAKTESLVLELTSSSRTNNGDGGGGDVKGAGGGGGRAAKVQMFPPETVATSLVPSLDDVMPVSSCIY